MANLKHIARAYFNLAKIGLKIGSPSPQAVKRLSICYKCNDNKAACPVCYCPVKAKVLEPLEECPKKLW